jgi:hypothetical protein
MTILDAWNEILNMPLSHIVRMFLFLYFSGLVGSVLVFLIVRNYRR